MKFVHRVSAALAALVLAMTAVNAQEKHHDGPSSAPGPAPQLVIESLTHDFGEVKAGEPLRFAFKVKNTGKGDLLINSVSPG